MTLPTRRLARSSFAAAVVASMMLSGCSGSSASSSSGPDGAASPSVATSREHDLRFVSPTAPACTVTWSPGATLPENYEWCSDEDGNPVAGVRIGSCEVITYNGEMYGVPGERISSVLGPLARDPQFTALLTACKRRPSRTA